VWLIEEGGKKMKCCRFLLILPALLSLASCTFDPKAQAQRYLENGNKFYDKGKFKEASIMYRRALQKDMRFGEAYYRLGLTDLKLSSYGDASRMLRRAIELQPTNVDAITQLADLFLIAATQDSSHANDMLKEVKDLDDKLFQQDPNSYDGHRLSGQVALLKRDAPTAVKELEKANAAKPGQPNLVLAYFQALVMNGQFPDAENVAHELIAKEKSFSPIYDLLYLQYIRQKRMDDAENVLKLKVQNNPQRANYLVQLAGHYLALRRGSDMDAVMQRLTNEKDYPEGHLLAGDFYFFRAREFEHAREQYEAAIKAFPKDRNIYQKRLVELYATETKAPQANELLATILKDNPKDTDAIAMRAALQLTTGNQAQINVAANDLQALVTKMPQNHLLRFNLARALVAKGDIESARIQLEDAIKIRPDFIAARELLGRIYLNTGDPSKGLKAADEILALDHNSLSGHLMRSSALIQIGDRDKARQELDAITRAFPENMDARYQVGMLAYQEKDYKRAEEVFRELYKKNPRDFRGLAGLTETLASEGHLPEVVKMWEDASKAEPQRRDLKMAVANVYVRSNRSDEAIKIYQSLLEKEPKSPDLLIHLAESERLKGDLNQAIDGFRRCSQAAPNNTQCLIELGLLMEATGKRDQAKPIYEQILRIKPDFPVALNNLAYIKAEEGADLDQALSMAQRAMQKEPNSPQIADTLGWIYIKKNLSEDAIRVFRELVVKNPNDSSFHYHYGMALLQKGDKPSAKRELQTAMKNHPSKDEAVKIQDLLQKIG
jgi:tetratricopeptide (TPR) repeat protein